MTAAVLNGITWVWVRSWDSCVASWVGFVLFWALFVGVSQFGLGVGILNGLFSCVRWFGYCRFLKFRNTDH